MQKTVQRLLLLPLISLLLIVTAATAYAMTQAEGEKIITAKILETMDSGGYTYMQVENNGKSDWVAIPKSSVKKGAEVQFYQGMVMKNFTSKTLNRTFATIIFSPGLVNRGGASTHSKFHKTEESFAGAVDAEKKEMPAPQTTQQNSGGSLAAIVPFEALEIEKAAAENGYTVGEIFQQAEKLNGKKISVRGKVVKFTPMIMGRNWIHLQDGTGNAMKNQHDLVITTAEKVKEGEIVVMQGTVAADRDFGAGYSYKVIVEKASLGKEQIK